MNAHPPADSIKPAICTIEGEQNLLGSLIVNPQSLDWIPTINAQDFYEPLHQQIFDVIRELRASDKKVSPITIQAFFPADRRVGNDMPLIAYLARLASEAIAIDRETVRSLAWTVLRKWVQRTAGNLSSELSLEMYDIVADADIEHMVGGAQEELGKIRDRLRLFQGQKIGRETMGDAMDLAISSIDEAYRFQKPCGISTGIEVVDNLTGPWEPGQQIIIGAGTKQGKGQPLDAPILTPFGYRPMGSLKIGSAITAPDGSVTKVIGIFPLGERQIFEVKFHDGTKTEVTDDHLWLCWRSKRTVKRNGKHGYGTEQIFTTKQIIASMATNPKASFHIPVTAPVPFTMAGRCVQPIPPYVLGVLLGDGTFRKSTLEFCGEDAEIASKVEEMTGRKLSVRPDKRSKTVTYSMPGHVDYVDYLKRAKLWGKSSNGKFIPKQYLLSSVDDRLNLARGLMDTDGWGGSGKADAAAFYTTVSPKLAEDAAWLFRSLGAVVNISMKAPKFSHRGEQKDGQPAFVLRIKHPDAASLFSLERKKAKCAAPRSMARTIVSITPTRVAEAQCIQVAHPSSLYITNDFIVTHNTALAMQCAMGLAAHGPVWIYSGEMSSRQLAMREIARRTGIPVRLQKEGRISKQQWEEIARVRQDVGMLPVYVETRRMTLEQIRNEVTELKRKVGLASMIVDHVGLLNWPRQLANKDEWEQSQIATQTLKAIYSDLGVPGISLVQLKKNTFVISPMKNFKDKLNEAINRRPRYTDLLGAVERDADHVLIPFNARPIIAAIEPQEGTEDYLLWEDCMGRQAGKAEIILSLSRERFFPIRREVEWHGQTTSFGPEFKGKQETMF